MKVEFSSEVAERMIADQKFCNDVERHVRNFNIFYNMKMVSYKKFGLLIQKESADYLKVSICE